MFIVIRVFLCWRKITDDGFKETIIPLLKSKYRLKFAWDVVSNHVKEKRKTRYKLSFKVFE